MWLSLWFYSFSHVRLSWFIDSRDSIILLPTQKEHTVYSNMAHVGPLLDANFTLFPNQLFLPSAGSQHISLDYGQFIFRPIWFQEATPKYSILLCYSQSINCSLQNLHVSRK